MLRFWLLAIALVATPFVHLFSEELNSGWAGTEITVDGDGDEWHDQAFSYFDDDKTAIAFKNNADFIYLIVISRDEGTISRLQRGGLSVWLNGEGKKNRDYGMRYRAGRIGKDQHKRFEGMEIPEDMADRMKTMEEHQNHLRQVITVFEKKVSSEVPNKGEQGPAAAATFGKDIYAVEFRIPIKSDSAAGYGLVPKSGKTPMIGLEFGYLTDDEKREMRDMMPRPEGGGLRMGMGGGDPSGGGMGGGMGNGRGGPGGPDGPRDEMRDQGKKEIWFNLKLATKQ